MVLQSQVSQIWEMLFGPDAEYDFSDKIFVFMRSPGGGIDTITTEEEADFEYDGGVYMVEDPFVNIETGRRYLGFDKGNPLPWFHDIETDNYDDASVKLMDENYSSSMINKLSKVPPGAGTDIWEKLSNIPPWIFVAILAFLVLLSQGTLSGLIPW